jgi:predicted MPP superfamily phosphohydrolase
VGSWAITRHDAEVPHVNEVTIEVPGLAREVTLLQVSDLGSDRFGPRQRGIEAILSGRTFDAVVITGDAYGGSNASRAPVYELCDVLRHHSSRVYYLPGNHDPVVLGRDLAGHRVPSMPTDRAVAITSADPRGCDVALVYGRDADTIAAAGTRGRRLLVIASHAPPDAGRLAAGAELGAGKHLFIAGHTHGGQLRLPLLGAVIAPLSWPGEARPDGPKGNEVTLFPDLKGRLVDGMYERDEQSIFVSHGLGSDRSVPRFLCQAEVVAFRFVPAPGR